jgi:hypothetical protein
VLLKDAGLLSDVLTVFLRAVFALQRRRARQSRLCGGQIGAVSFFFGSALQITPHFVGLTGTCAPEVDPRLEEALESSDDLKRLNPKVQQAL